MTALPGWLAEPEQLFTYLRAKDLSIGTGEALRATALLDRLTQQGRPPQTSQEAARFLAPLLCTTAEQQASLASVLLDFADAREVEAKPPPLSLPLQVRPSDFSTGPPSPRVPPRVLWIGFVIFMAVLTLVGALWLATGSSTTTPEGPPDLSTSPTSIGLTYLTNGLTSLLAGLRYALLPWFAWLLFRRFRQSRAPVLRRLQAGSGHVAVLQPRSGEPLLFGDASLRLSLQALRAHRQVPTDQLDVVRSLRATIAAGGRPVIVYGSRPRLPDYPILVEQLTGKDHLAALGIAISARLASERLAFAVYRYTTDPRQLRDALRHPLTLADVAARHGQDMLLLVSDGDVFIDPVLGEVRPWIAELAAWRNPVLLTPIPLQQWSLREQTLVMSGFIVLPATPAGLQALGEFLRRGEAGRPVVSWSRGAPSLLARAGRRTLAWHHDVPPDPKERDELLDALTMGLPKSAFDLLCVLALFGEVRLDLTLAAGREMTSRDGKPLLNETSFAALAWLPWFRLGRMPDWLRLDLVQCLDRRRLQQAHDFYKRWLTDLDTQRTDGEKLLVLSDRAFNRWLARLARSESGRVIRDVLFLSFMRKEKLDALNLEAPKALTRILRPDWADPTWITCALCVVLTGLAVFFTDQLNALIQISGIHLYYNTIHMSFYILFLELVLWHMRALGVIPLNRLTRLFNPAIFATLVIISWLITPMVGFDAAGLLLLGSGIALALINSTPRGPPILQWSEPPWPNTVEMLAFAVMLIGLFPAWVLAPPSGFLSASWPPIMAVTAVGTAGLSKFISREAGASAFRVFLFGWFGAVYAIIFAYTTATFIEATTAGDIFGNDWYYITALAIGLVYGLTIALWDYGRVRLSPICAITLAFWCIVAALSLPVPHSTVLPLVPILPLYFFLVYLAVIRPHALVTAATGVIFCAFGVVVTGAVVFIHSVGVDELIRRPLHGLYTALLYDKTGQGTEILEMGLIAVFQTLLLPSAIRYHGDLISHGLPAPARAFWYGIGYLSAHPFVVAWRAMWEVARKPGLVAVPPLLLLALLPASSSGLAPGITFCLAAWLGARCGRQGWSTVLSGVLPLFATIPVWGPIATHADPGLAIAALLVFRLYSEPEVRSAALRASRIPLWPAAAAFLVLGMDVELRLNFATLGGSALPALDLLLFVFAASRAPSWPLVGAVVGAGVLGFGLGLLPSVEIAGVTARYAVTDFRNIVTALVFVGAGAASGRIPLRRTNGFVGSVLILSLVPVALLANKEFHYHVFGEPLSDSIVTPLALLPLCFVLGLMGTTFEFVQEVERAKPPERFLGARRSSVQIQSVLVIGRFQLLIGTVLGIMGAVIILHRSYGFDVSALLFNGFGASAVAVLGWQTGRTPSWGPGRTDVRVA
jgi:hypothetical protein